MPNPPFSPDDLSTALRVLRAVSEDRTTLVDVDEHTRIELQKLAGTIARPDLKARKRLQRALLRKEVQAKKAEDEAARQNTGIRAMRSLPVFAAPLLTPPELGELEITASAPRSDEAGDAPSGTSEGPKLHEARKCYVCKSAYDTLHHFYDQLCPKCGDLNHKKRFPKGDLRGQVALVTGARVKIGFQAALLLLRSGCQVIVTTRFPKDAAARYAREPDFSEWKERLSVYGLDLRHTPSVEYFAQHLRTELTHLDYIIHNACQTVRRPPGFYAHLLEEESQEWQRLEPHIQRVLAGHESLRSTKPMVGLVASAQLSQAQSEADMLLPDQNQSLATLFPEGALDADLQQIDLRDHNSWRLTLEEVPTTELLEVFLVNAVAPFVLSAKLKSLMQAKDAHGQRVALRHIVNVSAMEGQFYRPYKTDKHPHTNMAKAALNMLTRTSAQDYIRDQIYMNAVDTGWVTDEDPNHLAQRKVEEHAFSPPLDIVDGAARIVDPIFAGLEAGEFPWGRFWKDYAVAPW